MLRTFSLNYVWPVPCLGYGIMGDAILIDSPYKVASQVMPRKGDGKTAVMVSLSWLSDGNSAVTVRVRRDRQQNAVRVNFGEVK